MHEFLIASEAVNRVMEEALNKKAKRISGIEILIGDLSLLGKEQLMFWMKEMLNHKGEIGRNARINLKPIRALIECKSCGYQGNIMPENEDHLYPKFRCPHCNQEDIYIKKGKECVLKRIQLEV